MTASDPKSVASARAARPLLPLVLALLAGMLLGRWACAPSAPEPPAALAPSPAHAVVWTCSMDPQVRLPEPGRCPICGMDLVPAEDEDDDALLPAAALRMSENALALAGIGTTRVERRAVSREVRMVGKVDFDQTRLAYITAWVRARLDRLFVDSTGVPVTQGDHMVEVYSPELVATQQELLSAIETERALGGQGVAAVGDRQSASVTSARERLRLMGLEPRQIDEVVARGTPLERVTIHSPASGIVIERSALPGDWVQTGTRIYAIADLTRVWVQLDAYESDLQWLHYGQRVTFMTDAFPGETFQGRVSLIAPVLDDRTRTVKVRLVVENPDLRLKPDMFVRATVSAPLAASGRLADAELAGLYMCPMHPEVVSPDAGTCPECGMQLVATAELGFRAPEREELPLVIPATAPLVTGTRAVVYVRRPDPRGIVFEGREVVLGPRAGDAYVVHHGLAEGEEVVTHGAFKIDSELQIRARPSMMNPARPETGVDAGTAAALEPEDLGPDVPADGESGAAEGAHAGAHAEGEAGHEAPGSSLADVVAAYLELQETLAADDEAGSRAAAARAGALLSRPPAEADAAGRTALAHAGLLLGDAADVAARRAAFHAASDALAPLVERLGAGDGLQLVHCPMAFDDGADWLQRAGPVANPYFGARMLRCGRVERVLGGER